MAAINLSLASFTVAVPVCLTVAGTKCRFSFHWNFPKALCACCFVSPVAQLDWKVHHGLLFFVFVLTNSSGNWQGFKGVPIWMWEKIDSTSQQVNFCVTFNIWLSHKRSHQFLWCKACTLTTCQRSDQLLYLTWFTRWIGWKGLIKDV